jgi:hypothetical protein
MANSKALTPSYIEADFLAALTKNTTLMKASDTFKDYNYHGANMTMILELLSYLADFSSFHTNMVAKNVFMDSASIYETVHSLAQQKGYEPRGYVSAYVNITVELSGSFRVGDQLYVEPWQTFNTGLETDAGDQIFYTIVDEYTHTVTSLGLQTFNIYMRQGTAETLEYTGEDLIDNSIIMPFHNYDHGTFPYYINAINVWINDEKWQRTNDFYDLLSGLLDIQGDSDDVYMFKYDKYKRYMLQFNSSRNVPLLNDDIKIMVLNSLGEYGAIQSYGLSIDSVTRDVNNTISILNSTQNTYVPISNILTFTNFEPSIGGSSPENIEEIKIGARSNVHSQYRNITGKDYRYHLEARSDVVRGLAWGEQEVNPGNVLEYNKTYLSVIPQKGLTTLFAFGTINTEVRTWSWTDDLSQTISSPIEVAVSYVNGFRTDIIKYLEPRKMLNNYEVPVLPNIVYFRFDIGIRVRRTFNYNDVMTDVRNKLIYFFDPSNRMFNEEINFMDIHNFILDLSITSDTDDFKFISGADNLVLRDTGTYTTFNVGEEQLINEPPVVYNVRGKFPQYKYAELQNHFDNKLRPILLDYNQFPMLVIDMCRFFREI